MRIPIERMKELAKQYDLSHIILFAHQGNGNMHHIVTYGKTVEGCGQAADFGNKLKEALGWPEELLCEQPSRVKRLKKQIIELEDEVMRLQDVLGLRKDGTPRPMAETKKEQS